MSFSFVSLLATLLAAWAYANGRLTEAGSNHVLLIASIVWFGAAPFWMNAQNK